MTKLFLSKKELTDAHCENMLPGSSIPYTDAFKDSWACRVSFEAGYDSRQFEIDSLNQKKSKLNTIIEECSIYFACKIQKPYGRSPKKPEEILKMIQKVLSV